MIYFELIFLSERFEEIPGGNIGFRSYGIHWKNGKFANTDNSLDSSTTAVILTSTKFSFQANVTKLFVHTYNSGSFYADVSSEISQWNFYLKQYFFTK